MAAVDISLLFISFLPAKTIEAHIPNRQDACVSSRHSLGSKTILAPGLVGQGMQKSHKAHFVDKGKEKFYREVQECILGLGLGLGLRSGVQLRLHYN